MFIVDEIKSLFCWVLLNNKLIDSIRKYMYSIAYVEDYFAYVISYYDILQIQGVKVILC